MSVTAVQEKEITKLPVYSNPDRRITKVGIKTDGKILIEFEVDNETAVNGFYTSKFTGNGEACNEFYEALNETLHILVEALGLNEQWEDEGNITAITIKHTEDGRLFSVAGKCEINDVKVVLSSPSILANIKQESLLSEIEVRAIAYLDGDRKEGTQQSLDF